MSPPRATSARAAWGICLILLASPARPEPPPPKAGAGEPFGNGLASLAKGDFDEAERWFAITRKDFPGSEEGRKALLHLTFLTVSRELACVRLASLWKEAAQFSRVETGESGAQRKRSEAYEAKALAASGRLGELAAGLLALEDPALALRFELDSSGWEVDDLRARIRKGETLDGKETARLEKAEFILNYVGLLGTLLDLPEERLFLNPYEGTVRPPVLFNAVGGRLFIAHARRPGAEAARLAKACFERVLKLTADRPYDKQRMEAAEFLAKLGDARALAPDEAIRCPACKREMQPGWKFCPYDGRKLGSAK